MNIDWWSLIREARIEAWKNAASFLGVFLEALGKMLASGDPYQVIPAIIFIIAIISSSTWAIVRLVMRLTRYGALGI